MDAGIERHNDAVIDARVGHGLVGQPGRKHHELSGNRHHIHVRRLEAGIAKVHVRATQAVEVGAIKTRGSSCNTMYTTWTLALIPVSTLRLYTMLALSFRRPAATR